MPGGRVTEPSAFSVLPSLSVSSAAGATTSPAISPTVFRMRR